MNLNRATLLSDALKRDETGPCQAQPAKTIRRKKSLKSLSRCVLTPCKKMTKGQRNRQTAPYRQPRNRDRNMAVWQLHPTDRWRRASAGRTAWDRKIQSTASLARSPWDNGVGGYRTQISFCFLFLTNVPSPYHFIMKYCFLKILVFLYFSSFFDVFLEKNKTKKL